MDVKHDVGWLEVTVNYAAGMSVLQGIGKIASNAGDII